MSHPTKAKLLADLANERRRFDLLLAQMLLAGDQHKRKISAKDDYIERLKSALRQVVASCQCSAKAPCSRCLEIQFAMRSEIGPSVPPLGSESNGAAVCSHAVAPFGSIQRKTNKTARQ